MTPQRSGPSRLGIASCIAAVLAPVSSVISLLLMATVPDTYPPEMPEPGVIHLMIGGRTTSLPLPLLAFCSA